MHRGATSISCFSLLLGTCRVGRIPYRPCGGAGAGWMLLVAPGGRKHLAGFRVDPLMLGRHYSEQAFLGLPLTTIVRLSCFPTLPASGTVWPPA